MREWVRKTKLRNVNMKLIRYHWELEVYKMSVESAMRVFEESKKFPKEERYSLTDQIRRSSRSVATNIAEGFRKRRYPNMFASKLADSDGEGAETQVHLDFARDCGYMSHESHSRLISEYERLGKMIGVMMAD